MYKSLFIDKINVHPDWNEFLTPNIIDLIKSIESEIGEEIRNDEVCPTPDLVLRFLNMPLKEIKVIILGQDPYPQKGTATGRAFEVNGITSWKTPFRNPSLQNIIRAAFYAKTNKLLKYTEIRHQIGNTLEIHPPNKIFNIWESQGVLLLNTALTCKLDSPASHSPLWEEFTQSLISHIHNSNPEAYWFLWGNHALNAIGNIKPKNSVYTYHPSRCNERDDDFLFGKRNCFKETEHLIDWLGYKEVPTLF